MLAVWGAWPQSMASAWGLPNLGMLHLQAALFMLIALMHSLTLKPICQVCGLAEQLCSAGVWVPHSHCCPHCPLTCHT